MNKKQYQMVNTKISKLFYEDVINEKEYYILNQMFYLHCRDGYSNFTLINNFLYELYSYEFIRDDTYDIILRYCKKVEKEYRR